jgi:hypothetical protein
LLVLVLGALLGGCASGTGAESSRAVGALGRRLPERLHFAYRSLAIVKEASQIHSLELRTLYSTMPRPDGTSSESSVIGKQPLPPDVFADIWALLDGFDFGPYEALSPEDFRHGNEPSDTSYSALLYLNVDGREVISLALQPSPLKDAALQARLDELYESIDRVLRTAGARQGLASVGTPGDLKLVFGRTQLVKDPNRAYIHQYYLFPPESEALARELPRLQRLSEAHPGRLEVTESTIQVAIDQADFVELWRELRSVDIARFSRLQRDDFLIRQQRVTYEFFLAVDGRRLIHLMYTDREIAPAVAAPMVRIERLLDAKLWQKIRQLGG